MDEPVSFGYWLRRRRKALDLTQAVLADQVGCSLKTIQKLEAEERRPSLAMAERLAEMLRLAHEERSTFLKVARAELTADRLNSPAAGVATTQEPADSTAWPLTNLPMSMGDLIGREGDLVALAELLKRSDVRLVTITGAGGIGKTRLSLATASAVRNNFRDGVWFVDLAPINDPASVIFAIGRALWIPESASQSLVARVQAFLHTKQLLLLLDNFEQVLNAAPLVSELLAAAPELTIMVTSRAVLRLRGEYRFVVPTLALPDAAEPEVGMLSDLFDATTVAKAPSVQLFVARAKEVAPSFALTPTNASAIAKICTRLDGLPLAIELAAARIGILGPQALLERLHSQLAFLTGGARDLPARQQTMRATIAWSYGLLAPREQQLFRRLAIFEGGWTVDAAEAVCDVNAGSIVEGLQELLDTSLIRHVPASERGTYEVPRLHWLETIREYAVELLAASGEHDRLRHAHTHYFQVLAQTAEQALRGPDQRVWLDRLDTETENLRAALTWCLDKDDSDNERVTTGIYLIAALWRFWFLRGHFVEWDHWYASAVEQARVALASASSDQIPDLKGKLSAVLCGRAVRARYEFEWDQLASLAADSLALARDTTDADALATSLTLIGLAESVIGTHAHGFAYLEESVAVARATGDPWLIAWTLIEQVSLLVNVLGEPHVSLTQSSDRANEGLLLARATGDPWLIAWALDLVGWAAATHHDLLSAQTHLEASLTIRRELGDKLGIAFSLWRLGWVALNRGQFAEARRCNEERLQITHEMDNVMGVRGAYYWLGLVARVEGQYARAIGWCEAGIELARDARHVHEFVAMTMELGMIALAQEEYLNAARHFERALELARQSGHVELQVGAGGPAGLAVVASGATERGIRMCEESLALAQSTGQGPRWTVAGLMLLGYAWSVARASKQASAALHDSSELLLALGDKSLTADALLVAATIAEGQGNTQRAATCLGAADAFYTRHSALQSIVHLLAYAQTHTNIRAMLDEATFRTAWQLGQVMSLAEAIRYAADDNAT